MIRNVIYPPYKMRKAIPSHLSSERFLPVNIARNNSRLEAMTTAISQLLFVKKEIS
jgi:hypothetical protein